MTNNISPKKEGRIVVSNDAEAAITELTDAVNDGFIAGKATRFDVANYAITWFKDNRPSDFVSEIRRRSADNSSMLEALQKLYKVQGELPQDLQAALNKHFFGETAKDQKKVKKNLKNEYITDIHNESEVA